MKKYMLQKVLYYTFCENDNNYIAITNVLTEQKQFLIDRNFVCSLTFASIQQQKFKYTHKSIQAQQMLFYVTCPNGDRLWYNGLIVKVKTVLKNGNIIFAFILLLLLLYTHKWFTLLINNWFFCLFAQLAEESQVAAVSEQ